MEDLENNLKDIILKFEEELKNLRVGKAHSSMVENVLVNSYGSKSLLSHVSSISVPDAKSIIIKPWDKTLMPAIEQAIQKANLGIQPISDKDQIRISLPPLTEERRKELSKVVGKKMEETRITVRKLRDDVRKNIQLLEQNRELSENQKFSDFKRIDTLIEEINQKNSGNCGKKGKRNNDYLK